MNFPQIVFIVAGILSALAGITRVGFNSRKAQRMIKLLGVTGTQILYVLVGIALIVVAFTVDLGTL